LVDGRYRRVTVNLSRGAQRNAPPRRESRSAPKTVGESMEGRVIQSMEPSAATSAAVRPSPIAA
jgi:hypothetical protein